MKRLDVSINRCADCPYFEPCEGAWDGWCFSCEDDVPDAAVVSEFCHLEDA